LDFLADNKDAIEVRLFDSEKDLFNHKLDIFFWDTTSTYFEGNGPEDIAQYGFSKDKRPDRIQIIMEGQNFRVMHMWHLRHQAYVLLNIFRRCHKKYVPQQRMLWYIILICPENPVIPGNFNLQVSNSS